MSYFRVIAASAVLAALSGCQIKTSYYQKQVAIPKASWSSSYQPTFKIDIRDTATAYKASLLLRHDEAYPFSNIWLRMKVKAPGEKTFSEGTRIEKTLANEDGTWLGRGMGGIWEERIPIPSREMPKFNRTGVYEIKLEQLMRKDPLPSVMNIGIRIERAE
ncbi:MAG: gliding motility lipoprotein GldH [Edaphocola sp.]